ncbi:hypothetical protein SDC9_43869 [bioreactor metagenome]|uniref:Uncharacterized protein n=1 Tax=bioreactor metagenome TaxID=1076179 RepID=A0A644W255_9ZZZZ
MSNKRNFGTIVTLILVILILITAFTILSTRELGITALGVTGSPTPTIVAPQSDQGGTQLAWECPGCPT